MEIGPLEYVVIGFRDDHFMDEILPELKTIQQSGLIRMVDLLLIDKDADGAVTAQEIGELGEEEQQPYAALMEDLAGLLTAEDIEKIAGEIPPGNAAVVVLLEHVWTLGLTEAVRKAGGVLFTGGSVTPEVLQQVSAELSAKEENYA